MIEVKKEAKIMQQGEQVQCSSSSEGTYRQWRESNFNFGVLFFVFGK